MNEYQREIIDEILYENCEECECNSSDLPKEMHVASQEGNVDKIKDYIEKGYDINALYEDEGEGLLSSACAEGHVEVVKLLLQCPEIHLNKAFKESIPLKRAAQNGHIECARLLLDSTLKCKVRFYNCWEAVVNILKMQPELKHSSVLHILRRGYYEGNWDAVQLILQTNHHFTQEDLYPVMLTAVDKSHWEITSDLFSKDFYGKNELISEVFTLAVRLRCWEKVEEIILVMDGELKFELPFVEAALVGRVDKVQRMLVENQYDAQTLNGSLLVVAAGGTTEPVAELLMTVKNIYTKRTLSVALFLTALGKSKEILPHLISNSEGLYSLNDLYLTRKMLTDWPDHEEHEGFLESYVNKFIEVKIESLKP